MPRGGKREGAGRPKGPEQGTLQKIMARQALRDQVLAHLGPMVEAQIAHAKGIKFLVARSKAGGKFERVSEDKLDAILSGQDDGTTVIEIWDKDPSVQAFSDLLNRSLDKPAEHVEVTGAEGGPLVVKWQD